MKLQELCLQWQQYHAEQQGRDDPWVGEGSGFVVF